MKSAGFRSFWERSERHAMMDSRQSGRAAPIADSSVTTLVDVLLAEQRELTAVDRFSRLHEAHAEPRLAPHYRGLIPLTAPRPGEQYAFEVDLDRCSGCKGCVTACHSLNGLDEDEAWREVGFLVGEAIILLNAAEHPASLRRDAEAVGGLRGGGEVRTEPNRRFDSWALGNKVIPLQQTVTTACHHCVEPGCLLGCPVLAYDKDPLTGIVRHLDDQCIGCSYCILKCPYEVPKYSARRGIVRKCDMCHGRLAEGEAPACVQACPNEAIRITLLKPAEVAAQSRKSETGGSHRSSGADFEPYTFDFNEWLPDAPDPAITVPTTRYRTKSPQQNLRAADRDRLTPQPPHWPLVWMLLLTQMGAGLFLTSTITRPWLSSEAHRTLATVSWLALHAGLVASVFHLGRPARAWRAFLGWRTSWMSREILLFGLLSACASATVAAEFGNQVGLGQQTELGGMLGIVTALVGCVAVFSSAMIYADTHRPCWRAQETFIRFLGQMLLLGSAGAAVTVGWVHFASGKTAGLAPALAGVAFVVRTGLFVWERWLRTAARDNPRHPAYRAVRLAEGCFASVLRGQVGLFVLSSVAGGLAMLGTAGIGPVWATISLLSTFTSSVLKRMLFFTTAAAPKMPGLP